jgi:hypothetical protein
MVVGIWHIESLIAEETHARDAIIRQEVQINNDYRVSSNGNNCKFSLYIVNKFTMIINNLWRIAIIIVAYKRNQGIESFHLDT